MKLLSSILCCVSEGLNLAAQDRNRTLVWVNPTKGLVPSHVKRAAVQVARGLRNLSAARVSCSFPSSQSQHLPAWPPKGCCVSSHRICISGGKSRSSEGRGVCWPSPFLVSRATTWARSLCPLWPTIASRLVLTKRLIPAACLLGAYWFPGSSPCLCGVRKAVWHSRAESWSILPHSTHACSCCSQWAQLKDGPPQDHFPSPKLPLPPAGVSGSKGPVSLYSAAPGGGAALPVPAAPLGPCSPPASGKAPFGFCVPPAGGPAGPPGATTLLPYLTLSFPPGKRPSRFLS